MRLNVRRLKKVTLNRYESFKDEEGNVISSFSDIDVPIMAIIYPASGRLQAEIYGARLNYIKNMLYQGDIAIKEKDGINIDDVMYRVIACKYFTSHALYELEKV